MERSTSKTTATGGERNRPVSAGVAFALFSMLIALGVFLDGRRLDYPALAIDQVTLVSMFMVHESPELYRGDMLADHPETLVFYSPVYRGVLRLLSLPDGNYLRALVLLFVLTTLLWLWGWWLALSRLANPWLAAFVAFTIRMPLGPPGGCSWGATDLWWMQADTFALSLVPWVLWVWLRFGVTRGGWVVSCILCGSLANVHPPTAPGLAGALLVGECVRVFSATHKIRSSLRRLCMGAAAVALGALPYIVRYMVTLAEAAPADAAAVTQAIHLRLFPELIHPKLILFHALRLSGLFMISLPWLAWLVVPHDWRRQHRAFFASMIGFAVGCSLTVGLAFGVERLLHTLGSSAHFFFQVVRGLKWLLVPAIFLASIAMTWLIRFTAQLRYGRTAIAAAIGLFLILTLVNQSIVSAGLPIPGGNRWRAIWPGWGLGQRPGAPVNPWQAIEPLLPWLATHTPTGSRFAGPSILRLGSGRPVVHDEKSAGAFLHSSPAALAAWGEREKQLREAEAVGPAAEAELYGTWGAEYWVTTQVLPERRPLHEANGWFVYALAAGD